MNAKRRILETPESENRKLIAKTLVSLRDLEDAKDQDNEEIIIFDKVDNADIKAGKVNLGSVGNVKAPTVPFEDVSNLCRVILQAKDKGRDYFDEDFQRNFAQSMAKIRNSNNYKAYTNTYFRGKDIFRDEELASVVKESLRAIGLFGSEMTGINVLSNAVTISARKLASHIVENIIGLNKPMSIQVKAATTELLFSFYEHSFEDCRKFLRHMLLTDLPDRPKIYEDMSLELKDNLSMRMFNQVKRNIKLVLSRVVDATSEDFNKQFNTTTKFDLFSNSKAYSGSPFMLLIAEDIRKNHSNFKFRPDFRAEDSEADTKVKVDRTYLSDGSKIHNSIEITKPKSFEISVHPNKNFKQSNLTDDTPIDGCLSDCSLLWANELNNSSPVDEENVKKYNIGKWKSMLKEVKSSMSTEAKFCSPAIERSLQSIMLNFDAVIKGEDRDILSPKRFSKNNEQENVALKGYAVVKDFIKVFEINLIAKMFLGLDKNDFDQFMIMPLHQQYIQSFMAYNVNLNIAASVAFIVLWRKRGVEEDVELTIWHDSHNLRKANLTTFVNSKLYGRVHNIDCQYVPGDVIKLSESEVFICRPEFLWSVREKNQLGHLKCYVVRNKALCRQMQCGIVDAFHKSLASDSDFVKTFLLPNNTSEWALLSNDWETFQLNPDLSDINDIWFNKINIMTEEALSSDQKSSSQIVNFAVDLSGKNNKYRKINKYFIPPKKLDDRMLIEVDLIEDMCQDNPHEVKVDDEHSKAEDTKTTLNVLNSGDSEKEKDQIHDSEDTAMDVVSNDACQDNPHEVKVDDEHSKAEDMAMDLVSNDACQDKSHKIKVDDEHLKAEDTQTKLYALTISDSEKEKDQIHDREIKVNNENLKAKDTQKKVNVKVNNENLKAEDTRKKVNVVSDNPHEVKVDDEHSKAEDTQTKKVNVLSDSIFLQPSTLKEGKQPNKLEQLGIEIEHILKVLDLRREGRNPMNFTYKQPEISKQLFSKKDYKVCDVGDCKIHFCYAYVKKLQMYALDAQLGVKLLNSKKIEFRDICHNVSFKKSSVNANLFYLSTYEPIYPICDKKNTYVDFEQFKLIHYIIMYTLAIITKLINSDCQGIMFSYGDEKERMKNNVDLEISYTNLLERQMADNYFLFTREGIDKPYTKLSSGDYIFYFDRYSPTKTLLRNILFNNAITSSSHAPLRFPGHNQLIHNQYKSSTAKPWRVNKTMRICNAYSSYPEFMKKAKLDKLLKFLAEEIFCAIAEVNYELTENELFESFRSSSLVKRHFVNDCRLSPKRPNCSFTTVLMLLGRSMFTVVSVRYELLFLKRSFKHNIFECDQGIWLNGFITQKDLVSAHVLIPTFVKRSSAEPNEHITSSDNLLFNASYLVQAYADCHEYSGYEDAKDISDYILSLLPFTGLVFGGEDKREYQNIFAVGVKHSCLIRCINESLQEFRAGFNLDYDFCCGNFIMYLTNFNTFSHLPLSFYLNKHRDGVTIASSTKNSDCSENFGLVGYISFIQGKRQVEDHYVATHWDKFSGQVVVYNDMFDFVGQRQLSEEEIRDQNILIETTNVPQTLIYQRLDVDDITCVDQNNRFSSVRTDLIKVLFFKRRHEECLRKMRTLFHEEKWEALQDLSEYDKLLFPIETDITEGENSGFTSRAIILLKSDSEFVRNLTEVAKIVFESYGKFSLPVVVFERMIACLRAFQLNNLIDQFSKRNV